MPILKEKDKNELKEVFSKMVHPVKLVMFTQEVECQFCSLTREMLTEVAALSDKISLEIHDFVKEAELAKSYGIDKIPALAVIGEKDYGIRFYGVPAGYEFMTVIEDILDVGARDHGLSPEIMAELAKVDRSVHMQVMISPT